MPCESCDGSRLNEQANSVRFAGKNMASLLKMDLRSARHWLDQVAANEKSPEKVAAAEALVSEISKRLGYLVESGVHYLTLGRGADSLSGGELQRVRMGASIGSGLANVCYVLDEPSVGLHARDGERLMRSLKSLRENGNSLLVVEHDESLLSLIHI